MRRWLLPEAIEDVLPSQARVIEVLRARMLCEFAAHGYELVAPPLLEFVDSLLTGAGRDLDLRTFKLVDQLSGRTLGVRADITPQVARIDAHLLNRRGVARLCYCGPVLHTLPAGFQTTREPLQIGAELYGHAGLEADVEILRLLARALQLADVPATRIDLGHVGVFRALVEQAGLDAERTEELFGLLQAKDVPALQDAVADLAEPWRSGLLALPESYGDVRLLAELRERLPALPGIVAALDDLGRLAAALPGLPLSFDLADLRGYHYHSGVVFAAYCAVEPQAVALGGRYDEVGRAFGRARPATGFSMDLRQLSRLARTDAPRARVLAPHSDDPALLSRIAALRGAGEEVVVALPGHEGTWHEAGCDRQLVNQGGEWVVQPVVPQEGR